MRLQRWLRHLSCLLLVACIALPLSPASPALAQEGLSNTSVGRLFKRLRNRFRNTDEQVAPRKSTRRKSSRRKTTRQRNLAPAPEEVQEVEKLENARVVLVVGDFLANGLADGLESAFAESPGVEIVRRTSGSSGLVRSDFYNWPAEIEAIMQEEEPAVVLVMLGSNDRQSLRVSGANERVGTEAWNQAYSERAASLATAINGKNAPLIWVGMPSFKFRNMTSDMLVFNDIYRAAAERVGGSFVDIWDGFVNEESEFSSSGPDINGQVVRLRSSDGINMTNAGKRKIAFYAEKPLRKLLGSAASPGIGLLGSQNLPPLSLDPLAPGNAVGTTIPISFTDPELDGGDALLGDGISSKSDTTLSPVQKLAIEGIAPPARPGRADYFSYSRKPAGNEPPPTQTDNTSTTAITP